MCLKVVFQAYGDCLPVTDGRIDYDHTADKGAIFEMLRGADYNPTLIRLVRYEIRHPLSVVFEK